MICGDQCLEIFGLSNYKTQVSKTGKWIRAFFNEFPYILSDLIKIQPIIYWKENP